MCDSNDELFELNLAARVRVAKKKKNETDYGFEFAKKRKLNENELPTQAKVFKSEPKSIKEEIVGNFDVNNGPVMDNNLPIHVKETPSAYSEDNTKLDSNTV